MPTCSLLQLSHREAKQEGKGKGDTQQDLGDQGDLREQEQIQQDQGEQEQE
jgi:hypothetical protein